MAVPVAPGKPLTPRQRRRVERAVAAAEQLTGLQWCVYLGGVEGDLRQHAEGVLAGLGLAVRPAVLLTVAPPQGRFEIVTTPAAQQRVSDRDCAIAAVSMRASFAVGDIAGGITEGLRLLAACAGAGDPAAGATALPDVLG